MLQISRLLCAIDYSEASLRAVRHALVLADWYEAELDLLHVAREEQHGEPLFSDEELDDLLTKAFERERKGEVMLRQIRKTGDSPRNTIVEYSERINADLIVIGSSTKRAMERLFLGSTAEGVVRLARCPVLTVQVGSKSPARETVDRILVPVDLSEATKPALDYASELARTYEASVDILHVVVDEVPALAYGHHTDLSYLETWVKDAQAELEELADNHVAYENVDVHVLRGQAAYETLAFAEEHDSDLIVISTHGRTGVERLLLGSTAEKIVRRAPCPVFTIKSFGKSLLPDSGKSDSS